MNTILILHGWGIGSKAWVDVKKRLEENGYNVFTPDLPGFGANPAPEKPWTTDDYVKWVENYYYNNNFSQIFLIGHSFGGGLAVKFAGRFPEKIKGLILIAPKIRRQKNYRYYLGLIAAKLGKIIFSIPGLSLIQPLAKKALYVFIGTRDYYKLETEKTITMKETFKKVVGENLTGFLPQIKSPTLIVWGKKDEMTPVNDAYLMNKIIKGSKLEIIEDGKHALSLQIPEILFQKIINFIKI